MEIVYARPPNFEKIAAALPAARKPGVIFCYGDKIYNPSAVMLSRPLVLHEMVHAEQQKEIGVEEWWDRYIADPLFRIEQEVPAHIAEYRALVEKATNRHERRAALTMVAERLSSTLYGKAISDPVARKILEAGVLTSTQKLKRSLGELKEDINA